MSETIKKQIKKVLESHRDNLAFVIGNGINKEFSNDFLSWSKLIDDLYAEFAGIDDLAEQKKCNRRFSITLTELFDLIELQYYHKDKSLFENLLKRFSNDESLNKRIADMTSQMEFIATNPNIRKTPLSLKSISNHMETNKTYQSLCNSCRKWCEYNMEDVHNMTNRECYYAFILFASNNLKTSLYKNLIKKAVVERFSIQQCKNDMPFFMAKIKAMNAPVLTTNYDFLMSESLGLSFHKMGNSVSVYYPWNVYYSDRELLTPTSGFGIWHINGMIKYFQSIKLGLSDYMGNVERARRMIHLNNFSDFYNGILQGTQINQNWLQIIFTKNLFVFGLGLDEEEVFLRWLLIQRAKYSKLYHRELKGWYVNKDIDAGKRFFLEKIGIETIKIRNYKDLYEAF